MAPHIFISYNREDQHRARAIADALEAEGIQVWWDFNLRAGESYDEVTEKHLREAGAVVVLWSEKSVGSKWVRAEATVGERFSKLVPAMIEQCERPLRFELVQTADLTRWHGDRNDSYWLDFVRAVKSAIGHHEEEMPAAPDAPLPASSTPDQASPGDVTIENTFWNSIKDGAERSDFEAYLKRYPDGHFADLARNRIAMLERTAAAKKASAASPPAAAQRPPAASSPPSAQAPAQQRQAPSASPKTPASKAPPPQPQSKGGNPALLLGVGLVIAAIVAAVVLGGRFLGGDTPEQRVAASEAQPDQLAEAAVSDNQSQDDIENTQSTALADQEAPLTDSENTEDPVAATDATAGDVIDAETETLDVASAEGDSAVNADPGTTDTFKDCDQCPQMIVLPAGSFLMGSPDDEPGRYPYEGPQHEVQITSFGIGKYEVTFDQWAACVGDGGCGGYEPGDAGFGRGARPALYISWRDAQNYVDWLSAKTGKTYRLPTESEWEYAARAGAASAYWWGERFDGNYAALGGTVEAGALPANGFGVHEILGNAGEWVQDCYVNNFSETPTDGSAALSGDCGRRVVRGGAWRSEQRELRSANRSRITATTRDRSLGFRVAVDLD